MAALFGSSSSARSATRSAARAGQNDSWKADRFINFALPARGGRTSKLGVLKLKLSRVNEARLIQWLDTDVANLENFRAAMVLELANPALVDAEATGLDLGAIMGADAPAAPKRRTMGMGAPRSQSHDDEREKAERFINISVPTVDGGSIRLGGLPLYGSNVDHATLIDWLDEDESRLEALREKFIMDYRNAGGSQEGGIDFGAMAAARKAAAAQQDSPF